MKGVPQVDVSSFLAVEIIIELFVVCQNYNSCLCINFVLIEILK